MENRSKDPRTIQRKRDQRINTNFSEKLFFENPSGHGRRHHKSWMSAPQSMVSCGPGGGATLFDPGASGRNGQECLQEIRTNMFMSFFLPCHYFTSRIDDPGLDNKCGAQMKTSCRAYGGGGSKFGDWIAKSKLLSGVPPTSRPWRSTLLRFPSVLK